MNAWAERARALRGDIEDARAEMEALRRLPDALADKFAAAELYRLCVPKAYGGLETTPREMVETLEALAETDASAAWCVMIGATTGALAAYVDIDVAHDVFAPAAHIVTGVYAPMGRATLEGDHYRASGQWKWNSGGQNSHWLSGGCLILENGKPKMAGDTPEMRMLLFPRADVTFIDTWHTGGLRGTGSGDMAVKDLLVSRARSVSFGGDAPRIAAPLYRFPVFGLLAIGIAGVMSGNAKAALSEFAAAASGKKMPTGRLLSERSTIQAAFAQAEAEYGGARALLMGEIDAAWDEAQGGAEISVPQRARVRLAATHMVRTSAEVVRRVQDLAGGASVFTSDPLQRRLRDAQTATAHVMTGPATYEMTGRVLLGGTASTGEL
jgi:alkylation response protein AidB-like acyl-CoA dehydrogenase